MAIDFSDLGAKKVTQSPKKQQSVPDFSDLGAVSVSQEPPPGVPTGEIRAVESGFFDNLRSTVANSAIGHALQQTMPNVAEGLGLTPTDTVYHPDYEAHKEQLVSPENLIPASVARTKPGAAIKGGLRATGRLTSGSSLSTMAGAAATGGLLGPAVPAIGKLISLGFAVSTANDMVHRAPELLKMDPSTPEFYERLGELGFDAFMLKQMAKHASGRGVEVSDLTRPRAQMEYGEQQAGRMGVPFVATSPVLDQRVQDRPPEPGVRDATADVLHKVAVGTMNRVVRPSASAFEFGREPGEAALEEGAWGVTRKGVLDDVTNALQRKTEELQSAVNNADGSIDLRPTIHEVFDSRIDFLLQHGETAQAKALADIRDTYLDPEVWPNMGSMTPAEATEFKRGIGDLVKWSGDPLEASKADARRKLYGGTKEQINNAVPAVAPLNNRVSSLITAKKALETATRRDEVAAPLNVMDVATDIAMGTPAAITRKIVTSPGGMSIIAQTLNKTSKAIRPKVRRGALPPMPDSPAPEPPPAESGPNVPPVSPAPEPTSPPQGGSTNGGILPFLRGGSTAEARTVAEGSTPVTSVLPGVRAQAGSRQSSEAARVATQPVETPDASSLSSPSSETVAARVPTHEQRPSGEVTPSKRLNEAQDAITNRTLQSHSPAKATPGIHQFDDHLVYFSEAGEPVGYARIEGNQITHIGVLSQYQRLGIGRKLYEKAKSVGVTGIKGPFTSQGDVFRKAMESSSDTTPPTSTERSRAGTRTEPVAETAAQPQSSLSEAEALRDLHRTYGVTESHLKQAVEQSGLSYNGIMDTSISRNGLQVFVTDPQTKSTYTLKVDDVLEPDALGKALEKKRYEFANPQIQPGLPLNQTAEQFVNSLGMEAPEVEQVEPGVRNNASGESPASLEAQSRVSSENRQGQKWVRIDTRSGQEFPVAQTVDAVDMQPGKYDILEKRSPNGEVVDSKVGELARTLAARGASKSLQAEAGKLESADAETVANLLTDRENTANVPQGRVGEVRQAATRPTKADRQGSANGGVRGTAEPARVPQVSRPAEAGKPEAVSGVSADTVALLKKGVGTKERGWLDAEWRRFQASVERTGVRMVRDFADKSKAQKFASGDNYVVIEGSLSGEPRYYVVEPRSSQGQESSGAGTRSETSTETAAQSQSPLPALRGKGKAKKASSPIPALRAKGATVEKVAEGVTKIETPKAETFTPEQLDKWQEQLKGVSYSASSNYDASRKAFLEVLDTIPPDAAEALLPRFEKESGIRTGLMSRASQGARTLEQRVSDRPSVVKVEPSKEVPQNGRNFEGRYVKAALEDAKGKHPEAKQLFVKVPNDGKFVIDNTEAAIDRTIKATSKFAVSQPRESTGYVEPKPTKEARLAYIERLHKESRSGEGDSEANRETISDIQRMIREDEKPSATRKVGDKYSYTIPGTAMKDGKSYPVTAFETGVPGLVAAKSVSPTYGNKAQYQVTHEGSGLGAVTGLKSPEDAIKVAQVLADVGIDWTQGSRDAVGRQHNKLPANVQAAMRALGGKENRGELDQALQRLRDAISNPEPAAQAKQTSSSPIPALRPGPGAQTRSSKNEVLPRHLQWETPEFKNWFGESKVRNTDGSPIIVYRGDYRADRVGNEFKVNRATSGRFYFTEDPEIASRYAVDKQDVNFRDNNQNFENWYKFPGLKYKSERIVPDMRTAWYRLSPEQQARVKDVVENTTMNDDGDIVFDAGESIYPNSDLPRLAREHRGNWLKVAEDIWLSSGNLIRQEGEFTKILKKAGLDSEYDNPNDARSLVTPVYLSIRNPLDTGAIPKHVIDALGQMAKSDRSRAAEYGVDLWDKKTITPKEWFNALQEDLQNNTTHAWTRVPEKVTKLLQSMGYDGIKDTGGKLGGDKHVVWIAFEPNQIKSAIGNKGTFDPKSSNILKLAIGAVGLGAITNAMMQQDDDKKKAQSVIPALRRN